MIKYGICILNASWCRTSIIDVTLIWKYLAIEKGNPKSQNLVENFRSFLPLEGKNCFYDAFIIRMTWPTIDTELDKKIRAEVGSILMQGPIIEVMKLRNINFRNSPFPFKSLTSSRSGVSLPSNFFLDLIRYIIKKMAAYRTRQAEISATHV